MPLTKATLEVIDISSISDGLANDFGNTGGILEYITHQITNYDTVIKLYIDMNIGLLQDQITNISANLLSSGIGPSTVGVMVKSDNLAGMQNLIASRNNLGIYDATTTTTGLISIGINTEYTVSGSDTKAATPRGVAIYVAPFITTLETHINTLSGETLKTANNLSEYSGNAVAQNAIKNNLNIINPVVATTTNSGLVLLASSGDVLHSTGSNTFKAVTPQLLKSGTAAFLYRNKDIVNGETNPVNDSGEYSTYIEYANGYTICTVKKSLSGMSYPYTVDLPVTLDNIHGVSIGLDYSNLGDPLADTKLIGAFVCGYNLDVSSKYISLNTMYTAENISGGIERPTNISDDVFVQIQIFGSRGTIV